MRETRIYDSGDGWMRKVELWHGSSETFVMSEVEKENGLLSRIRIWKPYTREETKESWLSAELKRARENGDLE